MLKRIGKSIIIAAMVFTLCLSNMNSSCEIKAVTVAQNPTYQETINGVLYTYENYSSAYNKFEGVVIKKIQTPEGMNSLVLPDTLGGKKVLTLLMCDSDSLVEKTPITSVTLSKNITYRDGNTLESNGLSLTFSDTFSALEEIKVDAANPYLMAQDGVLFDKKGEWMISYPICKKDTEYVEPNTVKNAAGNYSRRKYLKKLTFSSNKSRTTTSSCSFTNLETVVLPNNIKKIGRDNFCFCEKLKKIKWSKNLKTIEASAFEYCYSLKKIKFPNKLKEIEMDAFKHCDNLKSITFPKGIVKIEKNAFGSAMLKKSKFLKIKDYYFHISSVSKIQGKKKKIKLKKGYATILKTQAFVGGKKEKGYLPLEMLTYQSGNKKIVRVTSKGKLKGMKKGTTTVKVKLKTTGKSYSVKVDIK